MHRYMQRCEDATMQTYMYLCIHVTYSIFRIPYFVLHIYPANEYAYTYVYVQYMYMYMYM